MTPNNYTNVDIKHLNLPSSLLKLFQWKPCQGVYTYQATSSQYIGTWKDGKREGGGEWIHKNHKYVGGFANDQPHGEGKYVFQHVGCEQRGEYVTHELPQSNEEEEEEPTIITVAKWKSKTIHPLISA